jgi:hypothetical protein
MSRFKSPISQHYLRQLLEPASKFNKTHPHAHRIIAGLRRMKYTITEVNLNSDSVWIGLAGGANLFVYNGRGNVLVQGRISEFGRYAEGLKRLHPASTVWQTKDRWH